MNYIFAKTPTPASTVRTCATDESKFEADYNCIIGIEGARPEFVVNDGATVQWLKSTPGDQAEETIIPSLLATWLNEKYNS